MTVDARPESMTRGLMWLVAWGAFAGGVGEFLTRVVLYSMNDRVNNAFNLNPQAIWMSPLANVPLFAVAIAVTALAIRRPAHRWPAGFGVAKGLVVLEIVLISERVHPAAMIVLATGVGVQAARVASRWRPRVETLVRASAIVMAALAATGGVWWNVTRWRGEQRMMASLPPAAPNVPNVLLLVLDTVGALECSLYGFPLETTPNLTRLAAGGIRFDQAIAPAPWTLPSHASMFTGRYPDETSVGWYTPLDDARPTLAEQMQGEGYATGGFVANLLFGNWMFGLERGFIRYRDYALSVDEARHSSNLWRRLAYLSNAVFGRDDQPGRKRADRVNAEFLAWQHEIGSRPFFAFLNYFDAHSPFAPPAPFDTMFLGRAPRSRRIYQGPRADSQVVKDLRLAYAGAVRYVDHEMGQLLDTLRARGVLRNTIVIITSDHGESFGEHGHLGHGSSLYLTQTRVPLVILLPNGDDAGKVVSIPVTLRDLAATVLDLARVQRAALPGNSLAPLWRGTALPAAPSPVISQVQRLAEFQPWYPAFVGDMRAILEGEWHFIARADGKTELYRVDLDPLEQRNLAADSAHAATTDSLQRKLGGPAR